MEITVNYDKKFGIQFEEKDAIQDQLLQEQLLVETNLYRKMRAEMFKGNDRQKEIKKSRLSWDLLIHDNPASLKEHDVFDHLWQSNIKINNFNEAEIAFRKRKAKFDLYDISLEEFKVTEAFKKAKEQVLLTHGHELEDGTFLFDYQVECAAHIVARRRLLNAMDMGLGSAKRSV